MKIRYEYIPVSWILEKLMEILVAYVRKARIINVKTSVLSFLSLVLELFKNIQETSVCPMQGSLSGVQ